MNTIVELVRHDKSLKLRHCSLEIFRERMQVFFFFLTPTIRIVTNDFELTMKLISNFLISSELH